MNKRKSVVVTVVLALAALAGGAALYRQLGNGALQSDPMTSVAPALDFVTLDGKTVNLGSFKGRWVLINFWASWCAPCIDELPNLVHAQDEYSGLGLQIIGPALDEAAAVKPMVTRFRINYPVSADFNRGDLAMRAFGNDKGALPFTVLIDPDGFVAERNLGGMSGEQLDAMLKRHLGRS